MSSFTDFRTPPSLQSFINGDADNDPAGDEYIDNQVEQDGARLQSIPPGSIQHMVILGPVAFFFQIPAPAAPLSPFVCLSTVSCPPPNLALSGTLALKRLGESTPVTV